MNSRPNLSSVSIKVALSFFITLSLMYLSLFEGKELIFILALASIALFADLLWINKAFNLFSKAKESNTFEVDKALQTSLKQTLKNNILYQLVKTKFFTLFYAFFAKHESVKVNNEISSFSYANASNAKDTFWVVAIAQLPTLPFLHLFLEKQASVVAAWVVTLLTLWSVIWYLAQVYAVKHRPIELKGESLIYRFGLAWQAEIKLSDIESVRQAASDDRFDPFSYFTSPIGSNKNLVLEFKMPVRFYSGFYFFKSKKKAVISLDRPERLLFALSERGVSVTTVKQGY